MKTPFLAVLLSVCFTVAALAADKALAKEEPKTPGVGNAKAEAAKPAQTAPAQPVKSDSSARKPGEANTPPAEVAKDATPVAAPDTLEKASELPSVRLPAVEVRKQKITELDRELHEQNRSQAREVKNTKAGELDSALNTAAINPTILGGYSTKVRTGLAQERVELMEFEKDLTEAMARAKTKEEKAALKKQIDDIRTIRRTLETPDGSRSR